jgi:hypothetical protein
MFAFATLDGKKEEVRGGFIVDYEDPWLFSGVGNWRQPVLIETKLSDCSLSGRG